MKKVMKYISYFLFALLLFIQSSGIFYVYSWTVNPNIYTRFPDQNDLIPSWNFNITYQIDDTSSDINTSSESLIIQKWDGVSTWWADITSSYQIWQSITTTQAIYNIVWLPFWKYRKIFSISDNNSNTTMISTTFYVDTPSFNISAPEYDIWDLMIWSSTFWAGELIVTVETVWAQFDVDMLKTALLEKEPWIDIIDWNGVWWFGYDQESYSGNISTINMTETIASQTWSLNIDWNKNTYTYKLKYWALINDIEQTAGIYELDLDFHVNFVYADTDDRCKLDWFVSFTCSL